MKTVHEETDIKGARETGIIRRDAELYCNLRFFNEKKAVGTIRQHGMTYSVHI